MNQTKPKQKMNNVPAHIIHVRANYSLDLHGMDGFSPTMELVLVGIQAAYKAEVEGKREVEKYWNTVTTRVILDPTSIREVIKNLEVGREQLDSLVCAADAMNKAHKLGKHQKRKTDNQIET